MTTASTTNKAVRFFCSYKLLDIFVANEKLLLPKLVFHYYLSNIYYNKTSIWRNEVKFRYILFDADGTLFDYEHAELRAFKKTLQDFDINGNIDILHASYKEINYAIWKDF